MTEKKYYSLRFLGTNAFHQKGYVLKTTNKVLNIGETADCEIRFEAGPFEPELYASIVENEDGGSWRLIQRSQYVKTQIAGSGGIGYLQQLKDGDVISFDGQNMELEFHIHHDSNYSKSGIIIEQHSSKQLLYGIGAAIIAILFTLLYIILGTHSDEIKNEDLKAFYSSIYITRVDSVQWIQIKGSDTTLVRPTKVMETSSPIGTAFLTTDGKLITARHCIEYWIGENIDLTEEVENMWDDDIKRWAILSETFIQEREKEDESQLLRVYFSVYNPQKPDEPAFCFCSTDPNVHINRYHDGILQLADFYHDYYWRTVRPYYSDLETELGDIVYIDVPKKGSIEMADSTTIAQLNQSSGIAILGHPNNSSGRKTTYAPGRITEDRCDSLKRVSPNLKFDANITYGFSGGPVFIRANGKIVVAGVVSKIDTDNDIDKKAVPITEIRFMEEKERRLDNE